MATPSNLAVIHPDAQAWTQARLDLIRKSICHPSMTEPEIALFLEQCRRTGADPMLQEAYCVPRRVKTNEVDGRGKAIYQDRYGFQMSEEGMASRCAKFPDYKGIKCGVFYEKDLMTVTEVVDPTNIANTLTIVEHKYEPNKDRGRMRGAWAMVLREGHYFSPEILYLEEYEQRTYEGQLTAAWKKGHTMILKCARAAARRRAYSVHFAGVYAQEELQLEALREADAVVIEAPAQSPGTAADRLRAKVQARVQELRAHALPAATVIEQPRATSTDAADALHAAEIFEREKLKARAYDQAKASKGAEPSKEEIAAALDQITSGEVRDQEPPPVEEPPAPADQEPPPAPAAAEPSSSKLSFGPPALRGKPISSLTSDDLIAACAIAEEQLGKATGKEKWFDQVKTDLQLCENELAKREADQQ